MAVTVARLQAVLSADTGQFDRAMDQSDSRAKGMAKTLGKAGLVGAVVGLGAAVKVGFGEFMEAQKVTAQTEAVLKSTGGVANVTAGQVDKLAGSLMRKSGVDDEVIKSGSNMLLTFTKIRNETGKGNDVFDQATKATLNLSVAMGKDMKSSAILVGKALNDPVKGAGALSRAGVQLTQDQKDMIKQLVEGSSAAYALSTTLDRNLTPAQYKAALGMEKAGMSVEEIAKKLNLEYTPAQILAAQEATKGGKTIEAQKILLGELETQFGGSAEAAGKTFAGQINIAKQTLSNLAGEGVGKVMPFLIRFGSFIGSDVVPWLKSFVAQLRGGEGAGGGLLGAFASVGSFVTDTWWPTMQQVFRLVGDAFAAVATVFRSKQEEIKTIVTGLTSVLRGVHVVLQEVLLPVIRFVFVEVLPRVIGTAIEVVAGITRAISAVVKFTNETAVPAFEKAWGLIKAPVDAVLDAIRSIVDAIKDVIEWLGKIKVPEINLPGFGSGPAQTAGKGPRGDAHLKGIGYDLMGASPVMAPFAAAAAGYGLMVTSGLRPGAVTANGTPSDHGVGKALDVAGAASAMAAFFKSLVGNRSVKQAFYDPLGSIFGGAWNSYREGGHSDHVHVATYDQGGVLKPGYTLAYNGTGRNEYVSKGGGEPILVSLVLDGKELARALFDPLKGENVRRGRLGGGLA